MARSRRLHTSGALQYLVLRANAGRHVFPEKADFPAFEMLVVRQLAACRMQLLAFCWLVDAAHFALRVGDVPLGDFVRRVAGRHAQRINRRAGVRGHLFRQRYRTAVLSEAQLPLVLSYLHTLPVRSGLTIDPANYAWSSHLSYLGLKPLAWVSPERVLATLERLEGLQRLELPLEAAEPAEHSDRREGVRLDVYRRFMEREIRQCRAAGAEAEAAGACGARRGGVDPDREILARLAPARHPPAADPRSLDRLIGAVATQLGVRPEALASRSRRRILSLGRAMVAWRAVRSGTARLGEVAYRLGRHPSTLSIGIERYRERRPDLFEESPRG